MRTIIIADCGSTSADWAAITGKHVERFRSEGFNASAVGRDEIARRLAAVGPQLVAADEIRFYGAGCRPGAPAGTVEDVLRQISGCDNVSAGSDLEAAIEAVAPQGEAIVAILGTGANCCRVTDGVVTERVRSAGYILGDDGSGAAMGRELMGDYIGGRLPDELSKRLEQERGLTADGVIDAVYRGERPNAWLGSFASFIAANISHPYMASLVSGQMERFVSRNIARITGHDRLPCHFVGSVAAAFAPQLRVAMESVGEPGLIIASPLDAIVNRLIREN